MLLIKFSNVLESAFDSVSEKILVTEGPFGVRSGVRLGSARRPREVHARSA